jgi:hypothetical protein
MGMVLERQICLERVPLFRSESEYWGNNITAFESTTQVKLDFANVLHRSRNSCHMIRNQKRMSVCCSEDASSYTCCRVFSNIYVWEGFKCSISKYANKRLGRLAYNARVIIPSPFIGERLHWVI